MGKCQWKTWICFICLVEGSLAEAGGCLEGERAARLEGSALLNLGFTFSCEFPIYVHAK